MTAKTSLSALRRLQIVLSLAMIASLFLPWINYLVTMMDNNVEKRSMSGWSLPYGTLTLVFISGSFLVSLLESKFNRRAAFCHMGFFCATLLMAFVVHFLQFLPGVGHSEASWGFGVFLVIASTFFASSAMLSPPSDATPR